jgi:rhodanese-related sulfurtransferase
MSFFAVKDNVNVVVDARTQEEWDAGHILGATLVISLDSDITQAQELKGCEYCEIIVYCRTGNRASKAIKKLKAAGFKGTLYNGQGVSQWQEAGYGLVTNVPSVVAPCITDDDVCPVP